MHGQQIAGSHTEGCVARSSYRAFSKLLKQYILLVLRFCLFTITTLLYADKMFSQA
jgi:hypothetical protein